MIVNCKVSNTSMRKYSLYLETTFIIRYNAIWLKDRSYLNITMRQSRQSGVASPGIITIHVRRQMPPLELQLQGGYSFWHGAVGKYGVLFIAYPHSFHFMQNRSIFRKKGEYLFQKTFPLHIQHFFYKNHNRIHFSHKCQLFHSI